MKYIRSTVIIILTSVVIIGLTLHWVKYFQTTANDETAGEKLVIFGPSSWDILIPGADSETLTAAIKKINKGFREIHPETGRIIYDSRGPISDGVARLRNAIIAEDQVDVVLCAANPVNTAYAKLGLISPLDDLINPIKDRFHSHAISNFEIKEQIWGAPMSAVTMTTFFYNRDLFDSLELAPPQSYSDFQDMAIRLSTAGYIPIVHQGKNSWMWTPYYFSALIQILGPNISTYLKGILQGETKFTNSENLAALQIMRQWVDDGIIDERSNELDEEGMKGAFLSGRAAVFFGVTWDKAGIEDKANFNWGMFPYPKIDNTKFPPKAFGGVESGFCLASNTKNPKLAKAYIKYVTRPENVRLLTAPLKPFATSHRKVKGVNSPENKYLRSQLPVEKPLEWLFPPELNEIIQRELQSMMAGSQSPAAAGKSMQTRFESLQKAASIRGNSKQ